MHDIGQSNMEQNYNEFTGEVLAGESPLQEILAQEAPLHETAYEAPFAGEYHETALEAPYNEIYESYQELPAQEAAAFETYESPVFEASYETPTSAEYQETGWAGEMLSEEVLSEEEELALTSELLEVQSEEELDRFLGKLVRRASGFLKSPVGKMLGGVLRNVARVALPVAGRALGTFVGGPAGAMIGGQLANVASRAMGLELTEMAPQDADFAAARQFVRFASDSARRAQASLQSGANPAAAVRRGVQGAAQRFAPALLGANLPPVRPPRPRAGRRGVWVRRGPAIVLYGA